MFRRHVYVSVPGRHILREISLQGEEELRDVVRGIRDEFPPDVTMRTSLEFVRCVVKEFAQVAEMNRLGKMGDFMSSRRLTQRVIRKFWRRLKQTMHIMRPR